MQRSLLSGPGFWCMSFGTFAAGEGAQATGPTRPGFSSSTSLVPETPILKPHRSPTEKKESGRMWWPAPHPPAPPARTRQSSPATSPSYLCAAQARRESQQKTIS